MNRVKIFLLLLFIMLTPVEARAFGPAAHKVVARIAYDNLTEEAKEAVDLILSFEEKSEDRNIERAATWADRVRGDKRYGYLSPLHFTNIHRSAESYKKERDCPDGRCLTEAASKYLKILGDETRTRTKRLESLKLVVHLVADLHQPLHLGLLKDRGGNRIKVRFRGEATNLHRVWDSRLVRVSMGKKGVKRYAAELNLWARRTVGDGEIECSGADIFGIWSSESRSIATEQAYRLGGLNLSALRGLKAVSSRPNLPESYILRGVRITDERLMKAGLRLACVLNQALSEKSGAIDRLVIIDRLIIIAACRYFERYCIVKVVISV